MGLGSLVVPLVLPERLAVPALADHASTAIDSSRLLDIRNHVGEAIAHALHGAG